MGGWMDGWWWVSLIRSVFEAKGFGVCFAISVLRVRLPVRGESDLQNVEAGGHWGAELREESGACFVIGFNTDTLRLATKTDSSSSSPLRCRVPL